MFHNFDDVFGNMDRMMNDMMNNTFGINNRFSLMNNMLMPSSNPIGGLGAHGNILSLMNGGMPGMSSLASMSTMPGQNYSFSSSVTTYSNNGSGRPHVYQSTKSQVCGPDGFRETKESERDSRTGLHKISCGRHLNDRGHIKQKKLNVYNGEEEEEEELINLDEEEAQAFHQEFAQKRGEYLKDIPNSIKYSNNSPRLALTNGPSTSSYNVPTKDNNPRSPSRNRKSKETNEDKLKKKQKKYKKPYGKN